MEHFKLSQRLRFLEKPVDGLQLLCTSDIFVSGGGTMNRESALLGTKTYSIFTGRKPYLDEYLQENGKLKFIESEKDIENISVSRNDKFALPLMSLAILEVPLHLFYKMWNLVTVDLIHMFQMQL